MRAFVLAFLLAIFSILILPTQIFADDNYIPDRLIFSEDMQHEGDYFAAGEEIEIDGTINGDAYIAGGEVDISGTINGDLLVAGGIVNISGIITQDVRVLGGQVEVSGNIGRNLSVVAGELAVSKDSVLSGNLVVAAGEVSIESTLSNNVTIASGKATFYEPVSGNIMAAVEELKFTDNSQVSGNLTYWSSTEAQGTDRVSGNVKMNKMETPTKDDSNNANEKINLRSTLYTFASNVLIGILLIKLLPVFSRGTAEMVKTKSLISFIYGFAALFLIPIFIIILLVSVVGFPLSLITLSLYLISMYLAKIFVALWIGRFILDRIEVSKSDVWAVVVGVLMYSILGTLPYIGLWVKFFAMTLGFGAILINLKTFSQKKSV